MDRQSQVGRMTSLEQEIDQMLVVVEAKYRIYKTVVQTLTSAVELHQEKLMRRFILYRKFTGQMKDFDQEDKLFNHMREWQRTEEADLLSLFDDVTDTSQKWKKFQLLCKQKLGVSIKLTDRLNGYNEQLSKLRFELAPFIYELSRVHIYDSCSSMDGDWVQELLTLINDFQSTMTQATASMDEDIQSLYQDFTRDGFLFMRMLPQLTHMMEVIGANGSPQMLLYTDPMEQCVNLNTLGQVLQGLKQVGCLFPEGQVPVVPRRNKSLTELLPQLSKPDSMIEDSESVGTVIPPRLAMVRAKRAYKARVFNGKGSHVLEQLSFAIGDYLYVIEWNNDDVWYCEDDDGNMGSVILPKKYLTVEKIFDDDGQTLVEAESCEQQPEVIRRTKIPPRPPVQSKPQALTKKIQQEISKITPHNSLSSIPETSEPKIMPRKRMMPALK